MNSNALTRTKTRNRIGIVVVILIICGAVLSLFFEMNSISRVRNLEKQHTFYEYVVTHHVGNLEEIDDGTGMDPQSYVLELNSNVSSSRLLPFTINLMKLYYQYDNGSTLTIMAPKSSSEAPNHQLAQAHYDDDHGTLYVTLSPVNRPVRTIKLSPKW